MFYCFTAPAGATRKGCRMSENESRSEGTFVEASLEFVIPGYKGYRAAEAVAASDAKIRNYISANIDELAKGVDAKKKEVMKWPGGLMLLPALENVTSSLKRVAAQLNFSGAWSASYGYKNFDGSNCDRMKAFDEALYSYIQQLRPLITALKDAAAGGVEDACAGICTWADEFSARLKSREELIQR